MLFALWEKFWAPGQHKGDKPVLTDFAFDKHAQQYWPPVLDLIILHRAGAKAGVPVTLWEKKQFFSSQKIESSWEKMFL